MEKQVSNQQANQLIENYQLTVKNGANLDNATKKDKLELHETIGDVVKQSEQIFPEIQNKKFNGEKIRIMVFFHNGKFFVDLTFKSYDGKGSTLCKTVAEKVTAQFSTMKGIKRTNVLLEINGKKINVKAGRTYQMNRNSMKKGVAALVAVQAYAYLH